MMSRLTVKLIVTWLLGSLVIIVFMQQLYVATLSEHLRTQLSHHLLASLDESLFSNKAGRINDKQSIRYVAEQINLAMNRLGLNRLYSIASCEAALLSVDGVSVHSDQPPDNSIEVMLPRNQIDRPVSINLSCQWRWLPPALVAIALALGFVVVNVLVPLPLPAVSAQWLQILVSLGYSRQQAWQLLKAVDADTLVLSERQRYCFEQLHGVEPGNFAAALRCVNDRRLIDLTATQYRWFLKSLAETQNQESDAGTRIHHHFEAALALALHEDEVVIDLLHNKLSIHGFELSPTKTPLFYYAWYARQVLTGDAWITNPQSNRPDLAQGRALAELMWKYDGHNKAISDLEQAGLKAKTLDQNRSKLKEELSAALGEELAASYLFEHEKDPATGRMRYRLQLEASQIRLIV